MDKYDEMKNVVAGTMSEIIPSVNERNCVMDYLYKHKVGDRLPRGKRFDFIRIIENKGLWERCVKNSQWQLINSVYSKRINPLLLSQIQIMFYASIFNDCSFQLDNVLNMIKLLEGHEDSLAPNPTNITKHRIAFNSNGLLAGYEHSHVALLPDTLLRMYGKPKNITSIARRLHDSGLVDLDHTDKEILSTKSDNQGRRQTGHWLITKIIESKLYYLGVFPHSFKGYDDTWIYKKLQEGEQLWKH
jgi:hypothetical protein